MNRPKIRWWSGDPYIPGMSGTTPFAANYPGDHVADVMTDRRIVGPGRGGHRYVPIEASYDPDSDTTRVQFQPIPEAPEHVSYPLTRHQSIRTAKAKKRAKRGRKR